MSIKTKSIFRMNPIYVFGALLVISCSGGDDGPSAKEIAAQKLIAHPWILGNVTLDAVDVTSDFNGLSIDFSQGTYSSTNGGVIWQSPGAWIIIDEEGRLFQRQDDIVVTLTELTDLKLVMTFTWPDSTFGPSRTSSTGGVYVFTLRN